MKAISLLESFQLSEEIGDRALSFDELIFMSDARKRKGCKLVKTRLTADERRRVVSLGLKCREYKERNDV